MRLSRLSGIPGDQNAINWVCPIERSVIFGEMKMVLSTDLMCCNVVFVRSRSFAIVTFDWRPRCGILANEAPRRDCGGN